ncbi:hypothetical protein C8R46DRAFT_1042042 [Mycena filopes]|nr:hypothetical protein C8R46DRAFT_1042042 [Mycena filopes]
MPRKATYRRNLFDHTTLTSLEAVENAVSEFLEIVHPDNVERVLEDVISNELPAVLRLILSRLDQELILTQIPRAAEGFSGSLAYQILAQLSEFFVFAHTVPHLREDHYQVVKEAPGVLAAMAAEIVGYDVGAAPAREKPKGNTQRAAKNERRRGTAATRHETDTLVAGPFERFDLPVPKTRGESEAAKELVLATYQSIMTVIYFTPPSGIAL